MNYFVWPRQKRKREESYYRSGEEFKKSYKILYQVYQVLYLLKKKITDDTQCTLLDQKNDQKVSELLGAVAAAVYRLLVFFSGV